MQATDTEEGQPEEAGFQQEVRAELKQLRRDVDLLSVLRRLDDLTIRVSRLEFIEEKRGE